MAACSTPLTSIAGTDCIGDSRIVINNNFNLLSQDLCTLHTAVNTLTGTLNTRITTLSSFVKSLSAKDSSTIDLSFNSNAYFLSADVINSSLGTVKFGQDVTTFGKQLLTSTSIHLSSLAGVKLTASPIPVGQVLKWDGNFWTNQTDSATLSGLLTDGNKVDITVSNSGITWNINPGVVDSTELANNAVIEAKIYDGSVTAGKIGASAVVESKIATNAVTTAKISAQAVTEPKIAANAITTTKILDNNVIDSKLATVPGYSVKGNDTGSTANPSNIQATTANTVLRYTGTNFGFGIVPNEATSGTSSNTGSTLVLRDSSGSFSAGVVTASATAFGFVGNLLGTALSANRAVLATQALLADRAVLATQALLADRAVLATQALLADRAVLADSTIKLQTARNIALSGTITGSANFDGTSNITISTKDSSKFCVGLGVDRMCVSSYGNTFFIMQDGILRAVGNNNSGSIGSGRHAEKVTLSNLCTFNPPLENDKVINVVSNYFTSFAITQQGQLYGTGYNAQGQLGQGDIANRFIFTKIQSGGIGAKKVIDVQAGTGNNSTSYSIHALTEDGLVYSWGDGTSGSLGNGTNTNINSTPALVSTGISGKTIIQILSVGGANATTAFCLASDGTVWSAGYNGNGQLGRPLSVASDAYVFKQVLFPGSEPIQKLWGAGDSTVSCIWARGVSGKIYGWGNNGSYRAIGNNSTADITTPIEITNLGPIGGAFVKEIYGIVDTGTVVLFATYTNGTVRRWGRNSGAELGNGNTSSVNVPSIVTDWPFNTADIKQISVAGNGASANTVAILLNDGSIYTSGYNGYGQRGVGRIFTSAEVDSVARTFLKVPIDKRVGIPIALKMGSHDTPYHNFKALLDNGKVLAWGYNNNVYPIGTDATPNPEWTPVQVLFS